MIKSLWSRLILPLVILFGIAVLIHREWSADGFFLNLATEIVGILITISYVAWIIKQNEKQRWLSTDTRITNRLRILINATVSGIRDGLGINHDILNERVMASGNFIEMHNEIIRIAEHVISPVVLQRIQSLDSTGWKSLATHVANSHNGTLTFLNVLQSRLSPEQISDLLDLQESLSNSLTFYTIFHELAGVPDDQLPETRTNPKVLQQSGYESTSIELQRALALAKSLSQSVSDVA